MTKLYRYDLRESRVSEKQVPENPKLCFGETLAARERIMLLIPACCG